MILDGRNPDEVPEGIQADIAIAGAGTLGLFLGCRLASNGCRVVVVEAGGSVADTRGNRDTGISIGRSHEGVEIGRARGLGGTSVLWGGQLAEFDEADLAQEGAAWPISYSELRR